MSFDWSMIQKMKQYKYHLFFINLRAECQSNRFLCFTLIIPSCIRFPMKVFSSGGTWFGGSGSIYP